MDGTGHEVKFESPGGFPLLPIRTSASVIFLPHAACQTRGE